MDILYKLDKCFYLFSEKAGEDISSVMGFSGFGELLLFYLLLLKIIAIILL